MDFWLEIYVVKIIASEHIVIVKYKIQGNKINSKGNRIFAIKLLWSKQQN